MIIERLFHVTKLCQNNKNQPGKKIIRHFGQDLKVAKLSTLNLTVSEIMMPSLKLIVLF